MTNLEFVRDAYEAMARMDIDWMYSHTSPEVRFRQGGRFPTAGVYEGRDAMFGHLMDFMTMVGGQFSIEARDFLASEERVAAVITVTTGVGDEQLHFDEIHLWKVTDGVLVEMDAIPFDPYAVDEFFARVLPAH